MIKFILYDDKHETFKNTSNVINKRMINYDCDYRIEKFTNYDQKLEKVINQEGCQKIYILDVEVPEVDGINLANKIRRNDWNSIIIFLSAYEHHRNDAYSERLMILDYVCKKDNYNEVLDRCIMTALEALNQSRNHLRYKFNSITYRIPIDQILYITKVAFNKKCHIYTIKNNKYEIAGTLLNLKKELGPEFKQSHKCCLVNVENVKMVDCCNNVIVFNNGTSLPMLSTRMRNEFEQYVRTYVK